jgi:hypothetical protein
MRANPAGQSTGWHAPLRLEPKPYVRPGRAEAMVPERCGVALPSGADARGAPTAELVAWLRGHGVPEARLREVQELDASLRGFQRDVLRYGLVKALIDKGYDVPRDAAAWAAFDAAMRQALHA